MKRKTLSAAELLNLALKQPNQVRPHPLAGYRTIILVLLEKGFTHKQIAQFLCDHGHAVHRTSLSRYLRRYPPTRAEEHRLNETASRRPGSDVIKEKRREESPGRTARSEPAKTEAHDDTDYSFLKVQGRPFTIIPRDK